MPNWVRVRDNVSGHEYDVEESSLRPGMTVLEGCEPNNGPGAQPRLPEHHIGEPQDQSAESSASDEAATVATAPAAQPAKSRKRSEP